MSAAAEKALTVAKMHMIGQPGTCFYTTILLSLRQEFSSDLPTAGTDGIRLIVNPDWFEKLAPKERIGLLAHEVLHVALDHMGRLNGRDPDIWNMAGDYVINLSLLDAGYTLPPNGLVNQKYKGMSTEQVYDLLIQNAVKVPPSFVGDIIYPDGEEQTKDIQQKVADIVLRAATQVKMMGADPGNIPAEILIELDKRINPKLPWNVILQNHLSEFAKDDYTFTRPNRRFLPNHYLPSAHSEALANIAVAVDSSCSVSNAEFTFFITEIATIQEIMQPKKITVIDFDTKIKKVQELTEGQDPFRELKFHGRGGTNIKPVMEWAEKNRPNVLLIFTDGEFSKQPIPDGIPIIWLIHNNPKFTADKGTVIHYDI